MITGVAEQILPGGETLVRVDGAAVLVSNAVPSDVLELEMQAKRRGVLRADIKSVLEPSDQRVAAPCPVAAWCGGCALQYISVADQAALKSDWVVAAFKPLIDAETEIIAVHESPLHASSAQRRRVRWFVGCDAQGEFLGFYAPASHRAVRHSRCMVLTPALNALRQRLEQDLDLDGISSVQAVQLYDGIHVVLELEASAAMPDTVAVGKINAIDAVPLQWWWRDADHIIRPLKKPMQVFHDLLPAGKQDICLRVGPDDFVQGQEQGNRELIRQIQTWAGSVNRIADLFCGIGNLSLPLAAATGAQLVGAELNPASVRAASANAKLLGVSAQSMSAQFVVANLFENFDLEPFIGADVLLLDPPRRGAKRVCSQIGRLLPKMIIMVSCDVAAGARDGALLRSHGYRLRALRGLDLFPYAGHVEAMSCWQRA
ncbi:class I SAM-dependent RNA methyltransferase [Mariprofundus ferrooxydans]|nr:class I SAM-dependent RNA methyltransferase [Mariprofundus ferrooxydans]